MYDEEIFWKVLPFPNVLYVTIPPIFETQDKWIYSTDKLVDPCNNAYFSYD
jgi:hypothetical protein